MKIEGDVIVGKGETFVLSADTEMSGEVRLVGSGQFDSNGHIFHGSINLSQSVYGPRIRKRLATHGSYESAIEPAARLGPRQSRSIP